MKITPKVHKLFLLTCLLSGVLIIQGCQGLVGQNDAPDTYKILSVEWWEWVSGLDASKKNPLSDETNEFCATDQSGDIWFLAGSNTDSILNRKCTLPHSPKRLFFPLVNGINYNTPDAPAQSGEQLLAGLDGFFSEPCDLSIEIDGKPIRTFDFTTRPYNKSKFTELTEQRAIAGPFTLNLGKNSILQGEDGNPLPAGEYLAASDGYWALISPLEPGKHNLNFRGSLCDADGNKIFTSGVNYQLTIPTDLRKILTSPKS